MHQRQCLCLVSVVGKEDLTYSVGLAEDKGRQLDADLSCHSPCDAC